MAGGHSKKGMVGPSYGGFQELPQAPYSYEGAEPEVKQKDYSARVRLTLGPGGRVVIPAAFRDAMQVKEGDTLLAWMEGGEMHLLSPSVGAQQAQALIQRFVPKGVSLADELIEDRRREVEGRE